MNRVTKDALGFASYDFANSGFVVAFQSFLFPIYLATVARSTQPSIDAEALWPWIVGASSLGAVAAAPFVGRLADRIGKAKVFCASVVTSGTLACLASVLFATNVRILAISFIVFNLVFELSQSLYDSFLIDITTSRKEIVRLSTFSWGFGYLGGAAFVGLYFLLKALALPSVLALLAVAFLVLAIPSMMTFQKLGVRRLAVAKAPLTVPSIRAACPVPWYHLAIYWIAADCVAGVMYFAPLHITQNVGVSESVVGGLVVAGQLVAFPLTILAGRIANRIGIILAIRISLLIWVSALTGLYLARNVYHVALVMTGMALVVGSTQALLRSHFATRIFAERSGEGMGFYAIAQKSASLAAPLLVGIVVATTGSTRGAFAALAIMMLVAIVLTGKLPEGVLSDSDR